MIKLAFISILFLLACFLVTATSAMVSGKTEQAKKTNDSTTIEYAIFAGGCFRCMEKPFEQEEGVLAVISGYSGGHSQQPTYKNYGEGGHIEVVQIQFDPARVDYSRLLDIYWRQVNPTDPDGQFVDRGHEYTTAIFYTNDRQKELAEQSKEKLAGSGRFNAPIVTPILPAGTFWPAEEYHQDYYKKNPIRYKFYRSRSGRDNFLEQYWNREKTAGDEADNLRARLTPLQYKVTQEDGTEPAFDNSYWNNKQPGIYVDIVSGEPLFSSTDKYDSGTGWPSFTRPLEPSNIVEKEDRTLFMSRTEVRSKGADSHLGHVFPDGPPSTGLRYCVNSAALRFVPAQSLADEGYSQFQYLFTD